MELGKKKLSQQVESNPSNGLTINKERAVAGAKLQQGGFSNKIDISSFSKKGTEHQNTESKDSKKEEESKTKTTQNQIDLKDFIHILKNHGLEIQKKGKIGTADAINNATITRNEGLNSFDIRFKKSLQIAQFKNEKDNILYTLHSTFRGTEINITESFEENDIEETPKNLMTDKDKMKVLIDKYPMIFELVNKFGLTTE